MYVLITTIRLADESQVPSVLEALEAATAALSAISSHILQRAINMRANDPQIIWRTCYKSEDDYRNTMIHPVWKEQVLPHLSSATGNEVERVFYRRTVYGAPNPDITGGIWRALIVCAREGTEKSARDRFEAEIQMMPDYVSTIRNWGMNRVLWSSGGRRWSYVWEQDYDDVEGLLGEYMKHPIHMGLIDRWFDPEHPDHIFDARRLRMVCPSPFSGIAPPQ